MTDVGFDPQGIRHLALRTIEAIEALGLVRSDDPAADEAVRVARNARRNLEDVWMPLLREIEASGALTAGGGVALTGPRAEWAATARWMSDRRYRATTDDGLLAELARRNELVPWVRESADRPGYERWLGDQRGLATEIARRVRADPAFAERVVEAASSFPLTGLLVESAPFPADVRADLLTATLADPWWVAGWEMDTSAASANALMGTMLHDPSRCLDVLGRDGVASALAGWPPLDQDLVAQFVVSALADAPRRDAGLLPAGYEALGRFVRLANDRPLDGAGFRPGAATGLARALAVYAPTLAPGLENEHAPVVVKSHGIDGEFDLTLGTREEIVDLLGAIARTPAAQLELGALIDASIDDALGPRPQVTVGAVAELAELIELAVDNENAEVAIATATRRSDLLRLGGAIGLGIAVGTALAGISTATRSVTAYASATTTGAVAGTVRADSVGGRRIRAITYQTIQLRACRRFVADADLRRAHGVRIAADRVRALEARVAAVDSMFDRATGPGDRQRAILNLLDAVRDAGGGPYLDAILEENSVDDLNEADIDTDR